MDNLKIYNAVRKVPKEAQKPINAGRLKGMTDINPMWRIKTLTEQFGVCGIGWYYRITDKWIDNATANGEITANLVIDLFVRVAGEWSNAIQGIGGSKLVASEKNGLYVNDECYKMALTDAISVACKSLGVGADIYWQKDNTKYNDGKKANAAEERKDAEKKKELETTAISAAEAKTLKGLIEMTGTDEKKLLKSYKAATIEALTKAQWAQAVKILSDRKDKQTSEVQNALFG